MRSSLLAACLIGTAVACLPPVAEAVPIGVSYLTASIRGLEPAINNAGEIVYLADDSLGFTWLQSSRRGALTDLSLNIRFPDINDLGEVVYSDALDGRPGLSAISTERGFLARGNLLSINDLGEMAGGTFPVVPGPERLVRYGTDASIVEVLPVTGIQSTGLSNSGELTYVTRDPVSGVSNLYSSTRGQLTFFTSGRGVGSHAANNLGQYVYTAFESGGLGLFDQDGTRLWDGYVNGIADLNDFGDVVFNLPYTYKCETSHDTCIAFSVVLMTSRPDFYASDGFQTYSTPVVLPPGPTSVPEPGTLTLLSVGLAGMVAHRSRRRRDGRSEWR